MKFSTLILAKILRFFARGYLLLGRPKIIGVTGNFGKTSTREAIAAVLSSRFRVRTAEKNYNNEIGFPLAVLDWKNYGKNVFGWAWQGLKFPARLFFEKRPDVLLLEYGADKPGDIKYLLDIARPDIAVVTGVGEIPVHVEFFGSKEAVQKEKGELVRYLPQSGHAVLNADDPLVSEMRNYFSGPTLTYGFDTSADYRIENFLVRYGSTDGVTGGISFKIANGGSVTPVRINGAASRVQALAAAAAFAVGSLSGLNQVEIAERLKTLAFPPGRMRVLSGISGSVILDDSYNAAPAAVSAALGTLGEMQAERKIAVLGDMKELGSLNKNAHEKIGLEAAKVVNLLITVGENARIIRSSAILNGLTEDSAEHFNDSREAGKYLKNILHAGDLVLVKGAQSMRMERAAEKILADPKRAKKLLVRQTAEWKVNE